ncbi:MAG: hypothetical protein AABX30_02780 [Nanoarchaeota archaeon]
MEIGIDFTFSPRETEHNSKGLKWVGLAALFSLFVFFGIKELDGISKSREEVAVRYNGLILQVAEPGHTYATYAEELIRQNPQLRETSAGHIVKELRLLNHNKELVPGKEFFLPDYDFSKEKR